MSVSPPDLHSGGWMQTRSLEETTIVCRRVFKEGLGVVAEFRLQDGSPVPPCVDNRERISPDFRRYVTLL